MPLITGDYPSFLGGESQQDDTVRSPNQLTKAINAWLHAAMGAGKRPPAEFVAGLGVTLDHDCAFHSIVRDENERYIVAVGHRSIRVFDHETGKEYTVNATGDALNYLDTQGQRAWSCFALATFSDTTFIVNRLVDVKQSDELSPGSLYGSAQTMSDLPKPGDKGSAVVPTGAIYNIIGSSESQFDDYYVQKQSSSVYLEVARPGIKHRFDAKTMPHILKRIPDPVHADGFWFSFGGPEWTARLAGDEQSNPFASIDGQRIREVFKHRDRLGLLAGENVLMSEVSDPFNLWRTSVTQVLDADPIDVSVSGSNGVTTLYHAVPFQSALFLAAAGGQFLLTAEPYLAAKNVKSDPVNSYSSSPYIRPKLMGESLYFTEDSGAYASVREYFIDDLSVTGDAADVTAHVPKLMPGRMRAMASASGADCVFFAPDEPTDAQLYVYFVRWIGDEKQQSAWTRWSISGVGRIVHMHAINDVLYAVAEAPGGGCELLKFRMVLNQHDADATGDYNFLLDRMLVVQPTYQQFGNETWIDLPYIVPDGMTVTVLKTDDWQDPGAYLDITKARWDNARTRLALPGNHTEGRVVVGMDYEHRLTLTKPIVRGGQNQAVLVGRTQVRDIEVAYKDGAYFELEVEQHGNGRVETYVASHSGAYTARVLNDSVFRTSAPTFHSGSRRFPVLGDANSVRMHLVNRLPFQCWFQSAQWRGMFVSRSRV